MESAFSQPSARIYVLQSNAQPMQNQDCSEGDNVVITNMNNLLLSYPLNQKNSLNHLYLASVAGDTDIMFRDQKPFGSFYTANTDVVKVTNMDLLNGMAVWPKDQSEKIVFSKEISTKELDSLTQKFFDKSRFRQAGLTNGEYNKLISSYSKKAAAEKPSQKENYSEIVSYLTQRKNGKVNRPKSPSLKAIVEEFFQTKKTQ
ncbi:MAG: hypothetical protein Q8O89_04235 [Nanoarchaeota archaeon]|nr:hypothetical protein [Nanoarchaeota archaeon]